MVQCIGYRLLHASSITFKLPGHLRILLVAEPTVSVLGIQLFHHKTRVLRSPDYQQKRLGWTGVLQQSLDKKKNGTANEIASASEGLRPRAYDQSRPYTTHNPITVMTGITGVFNQPQPGQHL